MSKSKKLNKMIKKNKKVRDEFKASVVRALGERVGFICSFPGCKISTIGPHSTGQSKSIIVGEASHITAASPQGPRFDKNMTPEERSSINNGIWMCKH
ncbi:MAG: hypothetical protein ACK4IX_11195, partial [Candidatus Sericytochromatia bacterium]